MIPPVVIPLTAEMHPRFVTHRLASLDGLCVLESAVQHAHLGRYSYVMADPWQSGDEYNVQALTDPLSPIAEVMKNLPFERQPELPPFQGGFTGVLSYEAGRAFDRMPSARHRDFLIPDFSKSFYDVVFAWDHIENRGWLISQGWPEIEPAARAKRATARARQLMNLLEQKVTDLNPQIPQEADTSRRSLESLSAPSFALAGRDNIWSNFRREDYLQAVERVIEYIRAGDIFQANLTQRLLTPQTIPSLQIWERLRQHNPSPFMAFWQRPAWSLLSASPERFLKIEKQSVETRPIKGTRRRQGAEADLFLRDELRESRKDVAENVMIVDLLRNDLSRVCRAGSVNVPALCEVETYRTVQHLVSVVTGELSEPFNSWDALRACFPGGSITGAPKVRATEIIAELEPTTRGPYTGTLFYMTPDLWCDSSILIRTFIASEGWLQLGVGGGIVVNSNPVQEFEETLTKASGMLTALTRPHSSE